MIQFQGIPRQTAEGQTDPISQDPSATAEGPTSTTAVDWHLKFKDIRYNVSLTKNYCIIVSMQKISSILKLIFKIQQISGSSEVSGNAHFSPDLPKIIDITFLNVQQYAKKLVCSIYSFWRPDWPHPFLIMPTKKIFDQLLIDVNLYQHAKNEAISKISSGDMVD